MRNLSVRNWQACFAVKGEISHVGLSVHHHEAKHGMLWCHVTDTMNSAYVHQVPAPETGAQGGLWAESGQYQRFNHNDCTSIKHTHFQHPDRPTLLDRQGRFWRQVAVWIFPSCFSCPDKPKFVIYNVHVLFYLCLAYFIQLNKHQIFRHQIYRMDEFTKSVSARKESDAFASLISDVAIC